MTGTGDAGRWRQGGGSVVVAGGQPAGLPRWAWALVVPLVIVTIVLLVLFAPPWAAWHLGRAWWRRRSFVRAHRGRVVLVCTRRRGWREFLENNLVPSLRGDVLATWPPHVHPAGLEQVLLDRVRGVPRPYLLGVSSDASSIGTRTLNRVLQGHKARGARDPAVGAAAAELVAGEIEALRRELGIGPEVTPGSGRRP